MQAQSLVLAVQCLCQATHPAAVQEAAGEQDPGRLEQLCSEGVEAAEFLQTYVVQGKVKACS